MSTFRKEAIENKHLDWMGKHALTLTKSSRSPLLLSIITIFCLAALITFGKYVVNVEASGIVAFRPNVYALTSPLDGIVTSSTKMEGEEVHASDTLYTITSKITFDGEEKHEKTKTLILKKISSLEDRKADITKSINRVKEDMQREITLKKNELSNYQQLLITTNKKIELEYKRKTLFDKYDKKNIISGMELHEATSKFIAAKEDAQRIKVSLSQLNYEIEKLQMNCNKDLEALKTKTDEYNYQLAAARQELTEATIEAFSDVTAPLKGKLGYSSVIAGDAVKKGDVIGVILPTGAKPMITLHLPSAAAGEVQPNQTVKIRVSSFPWRRYGKLNGTVKTISPTAIRTDKGIFFSVTVEPENNKIFHLQHGMEVTANITTGQKRIYQWLFSFLVTN